MSRIILISSGVHPLSEGEGESRGGLPAAIISALAGRNCLWFGWSGKVAPRYTGQLKLERRHRMTLATVDLEAADVEEFIDGHGHRTLWPLLHNRTDLAVFDRRYADGYARANTRLARAVHPLIEADDVVWVHDYHLLPFASELRAAGCTNRIGFFLHTPLPHHSVLTSLPEHRELMETLFAYDVIGFQTEACRQAFLDYGDKEFGIAPDAGGILHHGSRAIRVIALPVGIDIAAYRALLDRPATQESYRSAIRSASGMTMMVGVDRLDFPKGLPQRFAGYDRFLSARPEMQERLFLLQIAPPTRQDLPGYLAIRSELDALSGRINGAHATSQWVPIRYVNREHSREQLAGILRAARIGLVTPLQDGMNLVAKEFVAAQDPEDPGVLILSAFTGAATQLTEALIINPYSADQLAEAIDTALAMPIAERKRRWQALYRSVEQQDAHWWCEHFIRELVPDSDQVTGEALIIPGMPRAA